MKTKIIAGFPGIGKSYVFNQRKYKCLDSDSSLFSWIEKGVRHPDFPNNYIRHIKENLGKVDYIFTSTHKVVIGALIENGINMLIVYPSRDQKSNYLKRYKQRGSDDNFIKFLDTNWDSFINDIESYDCQKIQLYNNQFLKDVLFIENYVKRIF